MKGGVGFENHRCFSLLLGRTKRLVINTPVSQQLRRKPCGVHPVRASITSSDAAIIEFATAIKAEVPLPLQVGIKYVPAIKQFTGRQLTSILWDFVDGLATAAENEGRAGDSESTYGNQAYVDLAQLPQKRRKEVEQLLDTVADEFRLRLANKHSLRDVFNPPEVILLLKSYAVLQYSTSAVSMMLDSVAGFVVKRIKDRHLNAVSRPQDIAELLQYYAALRHNSVVIPELVNAVDEELKRQVASAFERNSVVADLSVMSTPRAPSSTAGLDIEVCTVLQIMQHHVALGVPPAHPFLQALMTQLWRSMAGADGHQAQQLLQLLAGFRHHPGGWMLELNEAKLWDDLALLSSPHIAQAARCFGALGHTPSPPFVAAALQRVLSAHSTGACSSADAVSVCACAAAWELLPLEVYQQLLRQLDANQLDVQDGSRLFSIISTLHSSHAYGMAYSRFSQQQPLLEMAAECQRLTVSRAASSEPGVMAREVSKVLSQLSVRHTLNATVADGLLMMDVQLHGIGPGGGQGSVELQVDGIQLVDVDEVSGNEPYQPSSNCELQRRLLHQAGFRVAPLCYWSWVEAGGHGGKQQLLEELVMHIRV